MPTPDKIICPVCGELKPKDDFWLSVCKECRDEYSCESSWNPGRLGGPYSRADQVYKEVDEFLIAKCGSYAEDEKISGEQAELKHLAYIRNVVKVDRYGTTIYEHTKADKRRIEECLCLHCDKLADCSTAKDLYAICVRNNIAMIITRCKEWRIKPLDI